MKKFITCVLVACIVLSATFVAFGAFGAVAAANDDVVTKYADLKQSNRYVEASNTAIRNLVVSDSLSMYIYNNLITDTAIGSTGAKEYSKQISVEYSDGHVRFEAGKTYTVNVVYDIKKSGDKSNFQFALVAAPSEAGNDATTTTIAYTSTTNTNWSSKQVLSAVVTPGVNNVAAGSYLRMFFAGSGNIVIESIMIQEVETSKNPKVVNCVDTYYTTKQLATDTIPTPTFVGATHAVFGGWFTDSALTSKATTITDGATYYARWTSVTREVDLANLNRMDGYNPGGSSASNTSIVLTNTDIGLSVAVNKTRGGNVWAGETGLSDNDQSITLEYADFDASVQDAFYDQYVTMQAGKRYAINIKYTVTDVSGAVDLGVVAATKALGWTNGDQKIVFAKNNITAKGSYVLTASYSAGDLIDVNYGGGGNANKRLRLAFEGTGTILIESITIQEIYDGDANTVAIKYNDAGLTYTAAAVKNSDGEWVIPEPKLYGDVVEKEFGGWYLDSSFSTELVTPVKKTTYYPKWDSVTKKADLTLSNRVQAKNTDGSDNTAIRNFTTENGVISLYSYNNPNSVDAGSTASNNWQKHVTIEDAYGNFRVSGGKMYTVTINYNYIRVSGLNKFQIALVGANSATENDAETVVIGGVEHTHNDFTNWYNNQTLTINFEADKNGLEAGDYLRLFFGGAGKIVINSITIKEANLGDDYVIVTYVDKTETFSEYVKIGNAPSNPTNMTGFYGWYRSEDFIGKVTTITESCTLYSKREKTAYSFAIDFDTQSTKDFYSETHTKSDWETTGGHAELATGLGVGGTDAMRLTYKAVSGSMNNYATNPLIWLHDTNIQTGDRIAKRFNGTPATRYQVTLKYKVEETDGKSIQLWVGTRQKSQSSNAAIHDFGTGAWQIQDTAQMGNTITEKKGEWVTVKATVTAKDGWFPVVLVKTNNQTARSAEEAENPFASILIDDITVSEVIPVINDTNLGTMDYENYDAKAYESKNADEIIGNKYGREVTTEANHTANGKNSLKLTLMSDSVQHSGNSVIAINKEAIAPTKGAAYIVKFWVMSKTDMKDVIWSINTVAGSLTDICAKHQIEVRNKVDLKAKQWTEITAYIPKLTGIPGEIGMLTVSLAANGQDGKTVYVDDISTTQIIDCEAIILADSDTASPFTTFYQRAFAGQAINTLPAMTKTGYIFNGWYDENGKEYNVSDIFPADATELKLYAKWVSTANATVKDFTAGSFDPEIYNSGVNPYVNAYENAEVPVYGITNTGSTQSTGWVKDSGMYGNGTAEYDGTLVLQNDNYNTFTMTYGRNVIALVNEDGSKFMVVKGQKYRIKYDYISGSAEGTSVIQPYISTDSGYGTFGYNIGQGLTHVAVHGTDTDYKTYEEYFVAEYTGYVYLTFTTRSGLGSQHTSAYHKVYVDNLEIKADGDVKKVTFKVGNTTFKTIYGVEGAAFPAFDTLNGDSAEQFDGFYADAEFKNRITDYVFTSAAEQTVYIKYKTVEYTTPSDFTSPIKLDFEDTEFINDYYRQGSRMTYWSRGEATPEWQLLNDSSIAYAGNTYMKLNGYPTYWNIAKFMLYDVNNTSGTMLLEKGQTYRITLMSRCEDRYDLPNLTVTLENPDVRYISQAENELSYVSFNVKEDEYANGYMCYTVDITVPLDMAYLPALAIRKNVNDLQTLYIDSIAVEKIVDYKVQFEENGGTEIDDFTVQVHEFIADPGMPFREGYVFKGWFYDKELTKAWDFDTMTIESDVTLYAKWEVEAPVVEETPEEEEIVDDGYVPTLLEGDAHEYPEENNGGLQLWAIILIALGGVVALAVLAFVIIFLIARKKKQ